MLFISLLLCAILFFEGLVESKVVGEKAELDTRFVEAVKAVLKDEGFGGLNKMVVELQKKVLWQEKQIRLLEARDRRRGKTIEDVLMKLGDYEKMCEDKRNVETKMHVSTNDVYTKDNEDNSNTYKQAALITGTRFNGKNIEYIKTTKNDIGTKPKITKNIKKKTAIKRRLVLEPENVGFTAYLDHNIDHMAHGHTIKLNQVLLNDGDGYNNMTGVFTVPTPGVYLFNFHYNSHYRKTLVGLYVDAQNVVDAISVPKDSSQEMMGSNTAILRLDAGQSVWLEDIIGDDGEIFTLPYARYATFSGVLLYY